MAKFLGTGLTVAYNSGAWSANHVRDITVTETADVVDSSGASDTSKTYLTALKDGTATLNIIDDSENATIIDKFETGTSSTLTVTKNGVATLSGTAIVTSRALAVGYNSLAMLTVNFQFSGGVA